MSRPSTGAITTGQCSQLPVSSFVREIKMGVTKLSNGTIMWSNGNSIIVYLRKEGDIYIVTLDYTVTSRGEKYKIHYDVVIVSIPSNLGKGVIYYFLCPFSGKKCKTLYMGYGSHYFKSKEAYSHRIYYASQLSSHLDRHNDKYWNLERKLKVLYTKHPKSHYKGKPTAIQQRIEGMERKREYHDEMRMLVWPKSLMKSIGFI